MGCTLASYHRDRCFGPVPGLRLLSRLGIQPPWPSRISSAAGFHSSTRNRGAAQLRFKLLHDLVKVCPGWKFED
jgi:hypothetical protein